MVGVELEDEVTKTLTVFRDSQEDLRVVLASIVVETRGETSSIEEEHLLQSLS